MEACLSTHVVSRTLRALQGGELVRKIILVGTGHRGNDMTAGRSDNIFAASYDPPEHLWLAVHFKPTPTNQAAGLAFLDRRPH